MWFPLLSEKLICTYELDVLGGLLPSWWTSKFCISSDRYVIEFRFICFCLTTVFYILRRYSVAPQCRHGVAFSALGYAVLDDLIKTSMCDARLLGELDVLMLGPPPLLNSSFFLIFCCAYVMIFHGSCCWFIALFQRKKKTIHCSILISMFLKNSGR